VARSIAWHVAVSASRTDATTLGSRAARREADGLRGLAAHGLSTRSLIMIRNFAHAV
jgi:hypothetical protein